MASKIPPSELVWQLERYNEDRSQGLLAFVVVFYILAAVSVYLRIRARRVMKLALSYDDYTIFAGMVGLTGIFILYSVGSSPKYGGIGKHVVRNGEATIVRFLKGLYAFNIIYTLTTPIIKISLLLLFRRIFPVRPMRIMTYIGIVFFSLLAISTCIVDVFNCTPINASWNKNPALKSKCVDPPTLYRVTAIINLVTDIIILLIPLPFIWRLQMSLRNRVALYGIFLLGGIVCIATALRLPTFDKIREIDITYTYVPVAYFTYLEVSLAIVCANLPTMRPLVHLAIKDFRKLSSKLSSKFSTSLSHPSRSGATDSSTVSSGHKRNKSSHDIKNLSADSDGRVQDVKALEKLMDKMVDKPQAAAIRGTGRPGPERPDSLPYIPTPDFEKGTAGRPFRDSMVSNLKLSTPMEDLEAQRGNDTRAYFDYTPDTEKDHSLYGSTIRSKSHD
ncbi:MAG: hypothetical protein M1814_005055 [Vezdaea aestivalis]|nr:MAG: hypothetical protein M1814_005055 [Vezdaea aestivalis]